MKKTIAIMVALGLFTASTATFAAYEAEKGTIEVKVKQLVDGKYKKVGKAKTYLLTTKKKVKDNEKANSKGKAKFEDLTAGNKYRVACKKDGFVSAKDASKNRYISGTVKVKSGKTVTKSCKLAQVL